MLIQVNYTYTYEMRPYLDLLLSVLLIDDSWQSSRIRLTLMGKCMSIINLNLSSVVIGDSVAHLTIYRVPTNMLELIMYIIRTECCTLFCYCVHCEVIGLYDITLKPNIQLESYFPFLEYRLSPGLEPVTKFFLSRLRAIFLLILKCDMTYYI